MGIGINVTEDFLDDSLEECLLSDFYDFLNTQNPDDKANCLKVASVNSMVSVARMTAMYISVKVTEKLATGIVNKFTAYWLYIEAGKIGKHIQEKIKTKNFMGKAGSYLVKAFIDSDQTSNRIEKMKLVNSELNRFDTHTFETQKILGQGRNSLNKRTELALKTKDKKKVQAIELARYKNQTSSWTSTDKKLYEAVTGEKLATSGKTSWTKKYKELNQLSTFAKDQEGNMINNAQVMFDLFLMDRALKIR